MPSGTSRHSKRTFRWRNCSAGRLTEIPCGVSIGIQNSIEELLEKVECEVAAGYQRIKVKVKPGWDVSVLEAIRNRFPRILLMADANSAYSLADMAHLKEFDRFLSDDDRAAAGLG